MISSVSYYRIVLNGKSRVVRPLKEVSGMEVRPVGSGDLSPEHTEATSSIPITRERFVLTWVTPDSGPDPLALCQCRSSPVGAPAAGQPSPAFSYGEGPKANHTAPRGALLCRGKEVYHLRKSDGGPDLEGGLHPDHRLVVQTLPGGFWRVRHDSLSASRDSWYRKKETTNHVGGNLLARFLRISSSSV